MNFKRCLMLAVLLPSFILSAYATVYEPPEAPATVREVIPKEADNFLEGFWNVLKYASKAVAPSFTQASKLCLQVILIALFSGIMGSFVPRIGSNSTRLICTVAIAVILFSPTSTFLILGRDTVTSLSEYGKLLLPVLTAALAANGASGTATALYAETAFFNTCLSTAVCNFLLPMIRLFLCLSIASAATGEFLLQKVKQFILWAMTWSLKLSLYAFTGFLSLTGVIAGNVDAMALKAAKLTISGSVPVVGSILSDASDALLSGFSLMRSSAGIYGLLTFVALSGLPFVRLGIQYLMLKASSAISSACESSSGSGLIADFASAMGLVLGTVATQTAMLIVSTVCFVKGVQ